MDDNILLSDAEVQALDRVARAVQERYPDVPAETIARRLRTAHQQYELAPIRDFVPLLVERALVAELRTGLPPDR
ncbi:three-helix bundle dimerization domain-containing protein [Actinoplanes sp. NPDC049802]|uniref:three-helix bundle dimerization domain-containing protein n=1 Tax=Actinoplanes sp. NPDC049802 TaxID=3154742 RepID=UPI00340095AF